MIERKEYNALFLFANVSHTLYNKHISDIRLH